MRDSAAAADLLCASSSDVDTILPLAGGSGCPSVDLGERCRRATQVVCYRTARGRYGYSGCGACSQRGQRPLGRYPFSKFQQYVHIICMFRCMFCGLIVSITVLIHQVYMYFSNIEQVGKFFSISGVIFCTGWQVL